MRHAAAHLDAVDEAIPRTLEDGEDVVVLWVEEDLVDLGQRDLRVAGAHSSWQRYGKLGRDNKRCVAASCMCASCSCLCFCCTVRALLMGCRRGQKGSKPDRLLPSRELARTAPAQRGGEIRPSTRCGPGSAQSRQGKAEQSRAVDFDLCDIQLPGRL